MDRKKLIILIGIIIIVGIISLILNLPKENVKIGLIADMSGRKSQISITIRNGINLTIDKINQQGGINGRDIELITIDHEGDPEKCYTGAVELCNMGISLIVGPVLSISFLPISRAIENKNVIAISPTLSIGEGIYDNILTVNTSGRRRGFVLSSAVIARGDKTVAIISDEGNKVFVNSAEEGFLEGLEDSDVKVVLSKSFTNKQEFGMLAKEIKIINPDALFVIASGIDTAGIIQQYSKISKIPHLYASMWAKSSVIEYGGKTVEGMIVPSAFVNINLSDREKEYLVDFKQMFNYLPDITSKHSSECVALFAKAANTAESTDVLLVKSQILGMDKISGITDNYEIDKYGDAIRQVSLFIVENGEFELFNPAD